MQVDFLLIGAAHGAAAGLADDRDDRHVIELGVVETVQQVDGTGPGGRDADADLAGELGVPEGLECRHLLMPGLDELRLVVGPLPGGEQAVDAVPGVPEDVSMPHSRSRASKTSATVSDTVRFPSCDYMARG